MFVLYAEIGDYMQASYLKSIEKREKDAYKSNFANSQLKLFERLVSNIPLHEYSTGLDISVGDGFWSYIASKTNPKLKSIYATDIVDNPVKDHDQFLLKKYVYWNFFKICEDSELPFEDNFFDVVYHMDVIEHTYKPYLFLKEQYRVLRRGGVLNLWHTKCFSSSQYNQVNGR